MSTLLHNSIQMVDLKGQYQHVKTEIDHAIMQCIESAAFINGPGVKVFEQKLATYLGVKHVIACANGTDALQIAMMALNLKPGDEVIVPAFTYVATAEVIALLQLVPVMVDVDATNFNTTANLIEAAIRPKTKAIVPVHLFGQSAPMEAIMKVAKAHKLYVIEDTAQAIGAIYTNSDGSRHSAGSIGDIGCTSFFPSKNLGCYGDGGALYTNNDELASTIRKVANHGQSKKYHHEIVGVNSRLDTLQAVVLSVKLDRLSEYAAARNKAADYYDKALAAVDGIEIPKREAYSSHVFHQYTLKVSASKRDALKQFLEEKGVPSMVYYPIPLHHQPAYKTSRYAHNAFPIAEALAKSVLSLPMHTELTEDQLDYISKSVIQFFK